MDGGFVTMLVRLVFMKIGGQGSQHKFTATQYFHSSEVQKT